MNFLPNQYAKDSLLEMKHSYLTEQFSAEVTDRILEEIRLLVQVGDFTLGTVVDSLEKKFAEIAGTTHAIGVGSGTDALRLSLLALGLETEAKVLTPALSFIATAGGIAGAGLRPEFCDIGEDLNLDWKAYSGDREEVSAIVPVHWAGRPINVESLEMTFPDVPVIEDACHAIMATTDGRQAGSLGVAAAFSFHPLKNLNVWGDGGIITTSDPDLNEKLRLLRNHGQEDRDTVKMFGHNSRLDSIQAIVALEMLGKIGEITQSRRKNAAMFDGLLGTVEGVTILPRRDSEYEVFHLYQIRAQNRDQLVQYLRARGIDAKVHYRIPLHLQEASRYLGFAKGDFPKAEQAANELVSLPVHEFITPQMVEFMSQEVRTFYHGG